MRMALKMGIFPCLLYIFVFFVALNYHIYYLANYKTIASSPIIQTVSDSTSQSTILYYIIGELIVISVIGFFELRYKFIRRFMAWLNVWLKKVPFLAVIFVLCAILCYGTIVYIAFGLFAGITAAFLIGVFFMIQDSYKLAIAFSIVGFFPILYLISVAGFAIYALIAYVLCVILGSIIISKFKGKNAFNILALILCTSIALWFGIILQPSLMIILLVVVAVYDYIAVFKIKHMQAMAGALLWYFAHSLHTRRSGAFTEETYRVFG